MNNLYKDHLSSSVTFDFDCRYYVSKVKLNLNQINNWRFQKILFYIIYDLLNVFNERYLNFAISSILIYLNYLTFDLLQYLIEDSNQSIRIGRLEVFFL